MSTNNNMVLPYIVAVDFDGTLVTDRYPSIWDDKAVPFGLTIDSAILSEDMEVQYETA